MKNTVHNNIEMIKHPKKKLVGHQVFRAVEMFEIDKCEQSIKNSNFSENNFAQSASYYMAKTIFIN